MKKREKAERAISRERIEAFCAHLVAEEKAENTVEKYLRDVKAFARYLAGNAATKETVLSYKSELLSAYAPVSINSMLVSLNRFFDFCGWQDLKVKTLKVQRQAYCPEEKELTRREYERLVETARRCGNERLALVLQTLCGTGIRVSELRFITVEAAQAGEATVSLKGKTREVLIVRKLQRLLLAYAKKHGIESGAIFLTRNRRPINRSNVWREMKALCKSAWVNPKKVFPHNLRHLFARVFYGIKKDLAKLADILGHTSVETTRIYLVSTGAEHRRYLENMRLIV